MLYYYVIVCLCRTDDTDERGLDERHGDEDAGDDAAERVSERAVRQRIRLATHERGGT